MCPAWKITCPVGHVSTQFNMPWDKIYMPRACGHALMSSPGSWSTLAQVMACCLMAPSHYLNQCWLVIIKVQLHSPLGNLTKRYLSHQSLKLACKLFFQYFKKSPRGQWVNSLWELYWLPQILVMPCLVPSCYRGHSGFRHSSHSQWKTTLHCNIVSHWLSP